MLLMDIICPEPIKDQVERLCIAVVEILAENLVGIYLHGSLPMGCFNAEQSDIDLLVVIAEPMKVETKQEVAVHLLRLSNAPRPIEITFVSVPALASGLYPVPYDLHYGEDWRQQWQQDLANREWRHWSDTQGQDEDLAGQIAVTRERGICLYGSPILETLPPVPEEQIRECFLSEVDWALDRIDENPVYSILNPCRAWAYIVEGRFLSKAEAGEWALTRLEEPSAGMVRHALALYRGAARTSDFDAPSVQSFAVTMHRLVRESASSRWARG